MVFCLVFNEEDNMPPGMFKSDFESVFFCLIQSTDRVVPSA